MAKIFVSRKVPGKALDKLVQSDNEVEISKFDRPLTEEELLEKTRGVDALLSLLTDRINGDVVDAIGPQLKIVSNYAVGFDNIDVEGLTNRGIVVTNTPSSEVNESVAEYAWTLMLSLARRVVEGDEAVRRGAYKGWEPGIFLGKNLIDKTIGIIGLGRIGSMVARRAVGFNVNVLYHQRHKDEKAEKEMGVKFASFDEILEKSDFLTLHCPLTEKTRHMMGKKEFAKMKKGAFIVNTSRGPVIDESELVDALRDGQIGGAGLDVYENEPEINPELIGMENVILTPHIASATWEARNKMGEQAVSAILDTLDGKKPENIVNDKVWQKRRK